MAPGARRRARDDPSILCFLTPLQGFTLTRELQPNGLHPAEIGRETGPDQATPASRPGRERLPSPPLAGQGRRLDLGLPLRSDQRRPEPQVAQLD
jgi:hypothetical protein